MNTKSSGFDHVNTFALLYSDEGKRNRPANPLTASDTAFPFASSVA